MFSDKEMLMLGAVAMWHPEVVRDLVGKKSSLDEVAQPFRDVLLLVRVLLRRDPLPELLSQLKHDDGPGLPAEYKRLAIELALDYARS